MNTLRAIVFLLSSAVVFAQAGTGGLSGYYPGVVGTAGVPTFTFLTDRNTGIYRPAADSIGFATNGTLRLTIANAGVTFTVPGLFPDGTAAAPSISFASENTKGFFSNAANNIAISLNSKKQYQFANNGLTFLDTGENAGGYINVTGASGGLTVTALGTNQNITLTPSGTGNAVVGAGVLTFTNGTAIGAAASRWIGSNGGNGVRINSPTGTLISLGQNNATALVEVGASAYGALQIASHTTAAGGIGFGADTSLYRESAGRLVNQVTGNPSFALHNGTAILSKWLVSGGQTYLDSNASTILRTNGETAALTLDSSQNATFAGNLTVGAAGGGRILLPSTTGAAATSGLLFGGDTSIFRQSAGSIYFTDGSYTGQLTAVLSGVYVGAYQSGVPTKITSGNGTTALTFSATQQSLFTPTMTGAGNEVGMELRYTTNKASGNDTGLLIAMTDSSSPGTSLPLDIQVGGASKFYVTSTGLISAASSIVSGANIEAVSTGDIYWSARARLSSPAAGKFKIGNAANTAGVTLDASTDGEISLRNFADNAAGTLKTGNVTVVGNWIRTEAGTAASPAYAFTASTGTGMYNPAANELGFSSNGTNALTFNSAQKATFNGIAHLPQQIKRTSAQFDMATDATLANVTGLSVTVADGQTYRFRAVLFTTSTANGGAKFAIGGTATATAFRAIGSTWNTTTPHARTQTTTLGSAIGATTNITTDATIEGTIVVNVGGTLTVQFAQNAAHADTSSVLVGSYFEVIGL